MTSVLGAAQELYAWAKAQNFEGHDPHDLLTSPFLRRVRNPMARLIALQIGRRSAVNLHKMLRVPKLENPKALALFIPGMLRAKDGVTHDWLSEAEELGNRLLGSMNKNGGWGYQFPWQSRTHFLPAGTPNIVTTSFAGNALIELYSYNSNAAIKEAIERSAKFVRSLQVPNTHAFGYAANDPQIVFNASLLGAEFLANAAELLSNSEYLEIAWLAAQFVAEHQRNDGGWYYGLEPSQQWEDSFHTGFIVCSMRRIAELVKEESLLRSAERGFEYYENTFLEPDFAIDYFPHKRYPIDAHALGQAMLTFTAFDKPETARHIGEWSLKHLHSRQGYFYYQRHRLFTNRIPYLRWSNAWMFRGLTEVIGKSGDREH
ncbi:MAG TPA: hypothetical protein VGM92_09435 [Candidatus Kapabacteria bacterium]